MSAEPLHFDCVCCQAHTSDTLHTHVGHVMVILIMYERGELEGYRQNLCFEHRRLLEDALKRGDAEEAS